ncbi:hypothetical protein CF319_g9656, partial [Tilletia indica]
VRSGRTEVRYPQRRLRASAPRPKATMRRRIKDADEPRGLTGSEPGVPRNRVDIDSDGKAEDVGRLGLRQQRMITARGVKAHSPLTGAVRRRPKTPKFTVR